jgi:hypothetical protein
MTDEPSVADQRRVMEILLACFDGDRAACDQAEAAITAAPDGWHGAFATLGALYVNLACLVYGEQRVREVLAMAVLDASLHERSGDG